MTEKQETGPIKTVSPPSSDSDESTTEEDQEENQVEQQKPETTKENIEKSFPLFERSLVAYEGENN